MLPFQRLGQGFIDAAIGASYGFLASSFDDGKSRQDYPSLPQQL